MQHLETNDIVSIIFDDVKRATDSGIILTETEAVLESQEHRTGTVYAAPEKYSFQRGKKFITAACPVKAGDRVMVDRYAGVSSTEIDGVKIHMVHVHEIHGIIEE